MGLRIWAIALLLLGIYLFCVTRSPIPQASGLEDALYNLRLGPGVSAQYHSLLMKHAVLCAEAYASSFVAPVQQGQLEDLKLNSDRAEAAAQELRERAPSEPGLLRRLKSGQRLLVAQLSGWQKEMRIRCGLLGDNTALV